MNTIFNAIKKLKKFKDIEHWNFEDEDIYVKDSFRDGKVLTLYTIDTIHPKEFPSSEMDRNLLREMALSMQGWKVEDHIIYSHRHKFNIYELLQSERFRIHCENHTCTEMYDSKEGLVVLSFNRGRAQKDFNEFEEQVLLRLSYITEAKADYWDLGARIEIPVHHYEPKGCKDCKDGYYYPFSGKRERCPTCSTS